MTAPRWELSKWCFMSECDVGGLKQAHRANAPKYFAAGADFTACERAITTHGGVGYAKEYDIERYLREIIISRIAPVSKQMILNYNGECVVGKKKSY